MTELERVVEDALKAGTISMRLEGVRADDVKIWCEIDGTRAEDGDWVVNARLGDGAHWTNKILESELLPLVQTMYGVFAKMGRERARA